MAPRGIKKPTFTPPNATTGQNASQASGAFGSGPSSSTQAPFATGASSSSSSSSSSSALSLPSVTLPKSGGAIRKVDEKFEVNPTSGSCALTIPITVSKARSASTSPTLSLTYNSGGGNGPFGLGWGISVPNITRKTDKGIPLYIDDDNDESDVFVFSGFEDLVPRSKKDFSGLAVLDGYGKPTIDETVQDGYCIRQYLPRIEGEFSQIERWTSTRGSNVNEVYWRVLTADNHTFIYGKDDASRISAGDGRIFSWLLSQSYDSYGNAVEYSYKAEDSVGVPSRPSERNRTEVSRSCNRYLKAIKYGNRAPNRNEKWEAISSLPSDSWMFEIVFDYGEHSPSHPTTAADGDWSCRQDPFSTYRAGFEIRTYRLCRRILMFHHFPSELGVQDSGYLVSSTNFEYEENGVLSLLKKVSNFGYVLENGTYISAPMPALTLEYSRAPRLSELVVQDSDAPPDFAGNSCQWIDLDSEGLPGILSEQADGWFYRRNLSANNLVGPGGASVPRFGSLELVNSRPAPSLLSPNIRLVDLGGVGAVDLIDQNDGVRGFYERTTTDGWTDFCPFSSWPNIDFNQPNVRFVDLTGDGKADIMVTEDETFTWYQALGKEGYDQARRTFQSLDEEKGPKMIFVDGQQAIYLSDFSGDGLLDLVRIRNGDICYWPSLGYGYFGEKVTMDNAPWFDSADQFTHDRLRLSDIDGSGTIDLLYLLPGGGVNVYRNLAGNGWSDGDYLPAFPQLDNISIVSTIDLLGNGCACLVWIRPLSVDGQTLRYIDLMKGQKPFLLSRYTNDLGLETKVSYVPSTRFYLDGQRDGSPWITKLPFPVYCVQKTQVFDHISKSYFSTRYAYHHGFYDRAENEFRGFGMVEQWDTEEYGSIPSSLDAKNTKEEYSVPPVYRKTWFHTGAYMISAVQKTPAATAFSHQFIAGYFESAPLLDDSQPPSNLTNDDDYREASRALKGMVLREELYADDGTHLSAIPYRVDEKNYVIEVIQPSYSKSRLHHGVFLVKTRESITVSHEREIDDPRITHTIDLQFDSYGNILKSVAIAYGRRPSKSPLLGVAQKTQEQTQIIYSEYDYTKPINTAVAHINPQACETREFQLTGFSPGRDMDMFSFSNFARNNFQILVEAEEIPYEQLPDMSEPPAPQKRLIESWCALYRSDDLTHLLPKGIIESLGLPGESYSMALTPGLIDKVYQRKIADGSTMPLISNVSELLVGEGGYVEMDGNWWIPSGRQGFCPTVDNGDELAEARTHFFTYKSFTDQFNQTTFLEYDAHDLLPVKLTDPLGNTTSSLNDYTHLQPFLITDANGNRTQILQNPLGEVVGTAVMGKVGGKVGDSLEGFHWAISDAQKKEFLANPKGKIAANLLGKASTRTILIDNCSPTTTIPSLKAKISRETHESDLTPPGSTSKLLISFTYFDGLDREIQIKTQADDGPLAENGPSVERWRGSGWVVTNNKGLITKQYEPFFDSTHNFRDDARHGISATMFYDPLERPVLELSADHSWTKVVYSPWQITTYDASDNVLQLDPRKDPDVGHFFRGLKDESSFLPTWYSARIDGSMGPLEKAAASKTAVHNNTPKVTHLDSLGRSFVNVFDNGAFGLYSSKNGFDIKGNTRKAIDAQDRNVFYADFDMCGNVLHHSTMDFGQEWIFSDVFGNTLQHWQDNRVLIRTGYDVLRRPICQYNKSGPDSNSEILFHKFVYGESETDAATKNLRGRLHKIYDQSGVITNEYDFKGNNVRTDQQLLQDYKSDIDWSRQHELQDEVFTKTTSFDALNRIIELISPDSTRIRNNYNNSSLLFSVETQLVGAKGGKPAPWAPVITGTDYDARDRKTSISYGNQMQTKYTYDPVNLNLKRVQTLRGDSKERLQDLNYTYDPRDSITHIEDKAQQDIYFRNTKVNPSKDYTYDPINRLIESSGREHLGQITGPSLRGSQAIPRANQPGDMRAMGIYTENYSYDSTANILAIQHSTTDASQPGWTQRYSYQEGSPLEEQKQNNRLSSTEVSGVTEHYSYDTHGNITSMPGFSVMGWDFRNQLKKTSKQVVGNDAVPETTYYVYDSNGNRVRKVTERQSISGITPTRLYETLYLGGFEIFRKYSSNGTSLVLERKTVIVGREAQTCRIETEASPLFRYQLSDHLGSVTVESDNTGNVLSYEEYSAFGQTTYQATESSLTIPKSYRFSGKEKDSETGLYYFGARYYAAWLGRWISPDPIGTGDGLNVYCYVNCNPVILVDPDGKSGRQKQTKKPTGYNKGQEHDKYKKVEEETEKKYGIEASTGRFDNRKVFVSSRLQDIRSMQKISHNDLIDIRTELSKMAGAVSKTIKGREEWMKTNPTYQRPDGSFPGHDTAVAMWKIFLNRIEDTYIMHGEGAPDLEERRNNYQWMRGSPDDAWVENQLNRLSSFQAGPSSSGASSSHATPSFSGASSSPAAPGSTGVTTQSAGGIARPGPAPASAPSGGAASSTNQANPPASTSSEWKTVTKKRR